MGTPNSLAGLLLIASLATLVASQYEDLVLTRTRRQSPTFNVHAIPKTSFSCADKQPGEYYADPEAQCQVYHICVPGSFGKMTKMSFTCPNGTIFSQSSRVCNSYDRVYCPLAERFYENVMGAIDTDHDEYISSRGGLDYHNEPHNSIVSGTQYESAGSRRRPVRPVQNDAEYDDDYDTTTTTQAPRRRGGQSRRFQQQSSRNVRPQAQAPVRTTTSTTTTTTTTTTTPRPSFRPLQFRPPPTAFRGSQTVLPPPPAAPLAPQAPSSVPRFPQSPQQPNAFASGTPPAGPPPLPQNAFLRPTSGATPPIAPPPLPPNAVPSSEQPQPTLRVAQRPQIRRPIFTTTTTTPQPATAVYDYYDYEEEPSSSLSRTRRAVPVKAVVLPVNHKGDIPTTSFTCQDKLAGGVYADPEADCELFHICVPIGKGKLLDYGLMCEDGTAFNQETGTCDEKDTFSCPRSLQLSKTDKTKIILADKKPWKFPKTVKRVTRDVEDTEEYNTSDIPETSFTCKDKTVGGYYADVETDCKVFHICTQTSAQGEVSDMKFRCSNGTAFDQKNLVCQKEELVACEKSAEYYNRGLLRFLEEERRRADQEEQEQSQADAFEITKVKRRYPKKVGDFRKLSRAF